MKNVVERRVFYSTGDDVQTLTLLRGIYSALNIESDPQVAFDKVLEALKVANNKGCESLLIGLCVETRYTRHIQDLHTLDLDENTKCARAHRVHFLLKKREDKCLFKYDTDNECFYALGYSYLLETGKIKLNRLSFETDGLLFYLLP